MTQTLQTSATAEAPLPSAGGVLFVLVLSLAWITVNPFANLGDQKLATIGDTSDLFNQIAYVVLAAGVTIYLLAHDPGRLRPLLRPAYLIMLAWLALSVATSTDPALSARRVIFDLMVILLAAALPLLPTSLRQFSNLIAGVVIAILVLCYAGVLLVPQLAVHQTTDVVEPLLAGDWRGVFMHKNIAGVMMVNFIFVGLFVARVRSTVLGWSIVVASAIFLLFCEAKSATNLLPLVLILSWAIDRVRSWTWCAAVVFGPLVVLNLFSVGSTYFETIRTIDTALLSDPTFTGRNEIWQFAIDHIAQRPWVGYGFGAFWETPVSVFAPMQDGSEAALASHAHNAFLNLALTIGIPGLGLAMLWTLVLPYRDLQRCKVQDPREEPLATLFTRFWLFAMYTCSFESVLFNRGDPHWFIMLLAMFGLRYLSVSRLQR